MAWCEGRLVVLHASGSDAFEVVELIGRRHAACGERLALAAVIPPHAERPSPKIKAQVDDLLRRCEDQLACFTMVVLGQGFLASTLISLASGVLLFTRFSGVPKSLHTELDRAAAWIDEHLQDPAHPQQAILDALRWTRLASPAA